MADTPPGTAEMACPPPACPVCAGTDWALLFDGLTDRLIGVPGEFTIWRCTVCDVWRIWPVPGNLSDYYPESYAPHVTTAIVGATRPWHAPLWRMSFSQNALPRRFARTRLVKNEAAREMWVYLNSPPASVFDYGCGSGRFLRFARQLGMETFGLDSSANAVAVGQSTGLRCAVGSYEALPLSDEKFDLIRLNHVLEHVDEPVRALGALRPHLATGGHVVVTVPNTESAVADLFGRDWYNLDAPRHVWDFNPHNLRLTMERAGFEVEAVQFNGEGLNVYQSIRYALERKGSRACLRQPADFALFDRLRALAEEWNAQGAGDWMLMTGKVKDG